MGRRRAVQTVLVLCICAWMAPGASADVADLFDRAPGANQYQGGFGDFNWVTGPFAGVVPNSGADHFLSFYGGGPTIPAVGITKQLGGVVEPGQYAISFYITKYGGGMPLELSDFTSLRIGGPAGAVTWIHTPTPMVDGEWVQWFGIYQPDPADVGGPFHFQAIFDLPGGHSLGFDGPIIAASGVTPARSYTWGSLKARYRP